ADSSRSWPASSTDGPGRRFRVTGPSGAHTLFSDSPNGRPFQELAMPTVPCLEARQLERLLTGDAPAQELDSATRYLEECPRCAETLDELLKHDTLMEVARSQTVVDIDPEADAVRGLLERVRGLHSSTFGPEGAAESYPF